MHPYRFVFLDGCSTAETKEWQHAFGILYPGGGRIWNDTRPPRVFMGWTSEKVGLGAGGATTTTCQDYGTTVNVFFDCWMSGFSLDYCIRAASVNYSSANYTVKHPSGLHLPPPGSRKRTLHSFGWNPLRPHRRVSSPESGWLSRPYAQRLRPSY